MVVQEMGYWFLPSEEDTIKFLLGKVGLSKACADEWIGNEDLYGEKEPWEIFEEYEGCRELFFYTTLKKVGKTKSWSCSQRISRNVGQGIWSNKGQKDPIFGRKGQLMGHKRCFRYESRKKKGGDDGKNGKWILKEYTLPDSVKSKLKEEFRDLALCILKRKEDGQSINNNHNNLGVDCPPDVVLGYDDLMESIRRPAANRHKRKPAAAQVPPPSWSLPPPAVQQQDESWLQTINWNRDAVGEFVVCDGGQGNESFCDSYQQGHNWNEPPCDSHVSDGQGYNSVCDQPQQQGHNWNEPPCDSPFIDPQQQGHYVVEPPCESVCDQQQQGHYVVDPPCESVCDQQQVVDDWGNNVVVVDDWNAAGDRSVFDHHQQQQGHYVVEPPCESFCDQQQQVVDDWNSAGDHSVFDYQQQGNNCWNEDSVFDHVNNNLLPDFTLISPCSVDDYLTTPAYNQNVFNLSAPPPIL